MCSPSKGVSDSGVGILHPLEQCWFINKPTPCLGQNAANYFPGYTKYPAVTLINKKLFLNEMSKKEINMWVEPHVKEIIVHWKRKYSVMLLIGKFHSYVLV